jgi:hypothetical protein
MEKEKEIVVCFCGRLSKKGMGKWVYKNIEELKKTMVI